MTQPTTKDHWFKFFVFDWLSSTRIAQMDAIQERGYLRLLLHCWADPHCSIPKDAEALARLSLMNEHWFNGCSKLVEQAFVDHPTQRDRYTHAKLYCEWKNLRSLRSLRKKAGLKSGVARRSKLNRSSTEPRTECEQNANQSESESDSNTKRNSPSGELLALKSAKYPTAFKLFWAAYPRRVGKAKAFKAWIRAGKRLREFGLTTAEAVARMHDAAQAFAASPKGQGRYVPYPATWLSEGRYDDDRAEWERDDDAPTSPRPGFDITELDSTR